MKIDKIMMKHAREYIGLSQTNMSILLGLGVNGWGKYEKGLSEPTEAISWLINTACTPLGLQLLINRCPDGRKNRIKRQWEEARKRIGVVKKLFEIEINDHFVELDNNYFKEPRRFL